MTKTKNNQTGNKLASLFIGMTAIVIGVFLIRNALINDRTVLRVGGGETFVVDIADEPEERFKGLSGRDDMSQREGMLFVYDSPSQYSFVMRDMNFSLDFVWIDENKQIIDITPDVSPDTWPDQSFTSSSPSQYILEINAGVAQDQGFEIGDIVEFNL